MNNRQNHIVDQVRKQGEVKVEELAVEYGVSVETIRRDLNTYMVSPICASSIWMIGTG